MSKSVSEKIAKINELQNELTRLRWAEEYDEKRAQEIRKEMKALGTPDVIKEVHRRMDVINAIKSKFTAEDE